MSEVRVRETPVKVVADRIARLERENRRWKAIAVTSFFALTLFSGFWLVGGQGPLARTATDNGVRLLPQKKPSTAPKKTEGSSAETVATAEAKESSPVLNPSGRTASPAPAPEAAPARPAGSGAKPSPPPGTPATSSPGFERVSANPNPFYPGQDKWVTDAQDRRVSLGLTNFCFTITRGGNAWVNISNSKGLVRNMPANPVKREARLINGWLKKGRHCVEWNGRTGGGRLLAPGTYEYTIELKDGKRSFPHRGTITIAAADAIPAITKQAERRR